MLALVEAGWGTNHPAFHQIFASLYLPDGTPEQIAWWIELQRVSTSPRNAVRMLQTFSNIDVRNLLPKVTAPTLIMHSKGDAVVPFEAGRRLASGIPGARFVPLESRNHILLSQEPAWAKFVEELRAFLA
jgi:pimeloyl-ACP methyl ester carboxylesterase